MKDMNVSEIISNTPVKLLEKLEVANGLKKGKARKVAMQAERWERVLEGAIVPFIIVFVASLVGLAVSLATRSTVALGTFAGIAVISLIAGLIPNCFKWEIVSDRLVPIRGIIDVLCAEPIRSILEQGPVTLADMQKKVTLMLDGLAIKMIEEEINGLKVAPFICENKDLVWSATYDIGSARDKFNNAIERMKKLGFSDGDKSLHYDRVPEKLKNVRRGLAQALKAALNSVEAVG